MLELTFSFHKDSTVPYFEQLYSFIREEIESGRIATGTKLPSIRGLSDSLKISKTTIEDAYQQLLAEGYIVSKARVGYFSLPPEEIFDDSTVVKTINPDHVIQHANSSIDIEFHPAHVDGEHFPRTVLRKIYNDVWKKCDNTFLGYGDIQGEWGLRKEIAQYLHHSRGVRCTPEQIIIGHGIQYSIRLLSDVLRTDKTVVAMEEPGYDRVRFVFERAGIPIRSIPIEQDGLNLEKLRSSDANLVYVTPSHQFPQGMVMPYHKRIQLLQWAKDNKGLILEDDYDGEFRYNERPIPSLQGLDGNGSVIYLGTFSKSLAPAIRLNYMVLPPSLIEIFLRRCQREDSPVSKIHQLVVQQFMELGYWEKHIRRMRRIYRNKHAILVQSIRSEMRENAQITGHGAGLHVSLILKTNYSEKELIERAESVGVKVYFLSNTWAHEQSNTPLVRLGFGGLSSEDIVEGVKRLNSCWFHCY